mgnify:CR=1 FL=1
MTNKTAKRYASYCKYVETITMIGSITIFVCVVVGLFALANYVNAWEIANNYPYGKLCDLYNNC